MNGIKDQMKDKNGIDIDVNDYVYVLINGYKFVGIIYKIKQKHGDWFDWVDVILLDYHYKNYYVPVISNNLEKLSTEEATLVIFENS